MTPLKGVLSPTGQSGQGDRLEAMTPSAIRVIHDFWQQQRRQDPNREWIPLHFGEPDLGTPRFIVEAGCAALRDGVVFYENNSGRPDLKETLAWHFDKQYGISLTPDNFLITCGGMQAIFIAMLGLLRPGDDVVNLTPAWPNFSEAAQIAGARVHEFPQRFDSQHRKFDLDLDALKRRVEEIGSVRMMIVNTPSNPTGLVISSPVKESLVTFCRERRIYLLADEIYDRITFTEAPASVLKWKQPGDRLLVINGFSKAYCMTGWRIGYLVLDADLAAELARMQEFVVSHAPGMAQVAAITALRDGEPFLAQSLERYRALRDLVLDRLGKLSGAIVARPDGGIYVFFRLRDVTDSVQFSRQVLAATGVVLAPGKAFGASGEPWLRICFAKDAELLEKGLDRVRRFLESR